MNKFRTYIYCINCATELLNIGFCHLICPKCNYEEWIEYTSNTTGE